MTIKVTPLGAGQDVGRSCILLSINGKNIMLDCGMHMGYHDHKRYPDFTYLSSSGNFDKVLDCIIISHFHLDHCGALPYFTEICGFSGPIYMTHPTRSIAPILLEDMRKVMVDRKGETNFFTSLDIRNCMQKVVGVDLHEVIQVDDELEIKAYYGGHVLGAALFHIKVTNIYGASETCVYTGDYNMTPDRHLGSAWIDECEPDLLISESTYATTIRDSKRARERDFLRKVHDAVQKGGKVLVPVFALGRAQELLILIESYWKRMSDLKDIPIYFSAGLTERANDYYKMFISWTNEKIKKTFVEQNMFDFKMIEGWKPEYAEKPGPMVLFASPGMLHAGTSLAVFQKWCSNPLNMVIMPGYCVAGTVGAKVLAGEKEIAIDRFNTVQVNMQIQNLSFSAHADAKGIMALITMARAKNVMLVHGEKAKMAKLKMRIESEMKIPTFDPANGETITIRPEPNVPVQISETFLLQCYKKAVSEKMETDELTSIAKLPVSGCIIVDNDSKKFKKRQLHLISDAEARKMYNYVKSDEMASITQPFPPALVLPKGYNENWKERLRDYLLQELKRAYNGEKEVGYNEKTSEVQVGSLRFSITDEFAFDISWHSLLHAEAVELQTKLNSLDLSLAIL